jgi:trehalose 2-sulfotransferase
MQDSGVLGYPAEYFHRSDEQFWRARWGAADEDAFLLAVQREPATVNGVWASKMMWNYFADAVARLRAWPRLELAPTATDAAVLATALPGLRYVWLRRNDKLRQAISWWRAGATGQYALTPDTVAAEPPAFDHDAIERLVHYAEVCEQGWRDWFAANSIEPLEIVYEDLIKDLDKAVRDVAGFLDVAVPLRVSRVQPRLLRQADDHTERFAQQFNHLDNASSARGDSQARDVENRGAGVTSG